MELKATPPLALAQGGLFLRNPFNGIESHPVLGHSCAPVRVNPFNGIERSLSLKPLAKTPLSPESIQWN